MAELQTSPFDGVDPWLEGWGWSSVQLSLCTRLRDRLQPLVPEPYYVACGERRYREDGVIGEPFEGFVEVRDLSRGHTVVTVLEVISPANKQRGPGRDEYLRTQALLLASSANLIEIDLLRAGEPVVALPPERAPPSAYRVVMTAGHDRRRRDLYPLGVRDRLPRIPVPLTPSKFVEVDLSDALREVWDGKVGVGSWIG